ncbi:hypothetical protein Zm00014a_027977 [Zea mays]|uniref:Uncharacterized protein n=1 Tax=Zea mays TaxID=4577 RepID=A0A3L6DZA5_MAIZE|nr:hypothetical protein Zm00014a_027977 [Zea mays]
MVKTVPTNEKLFIGADLNGHVGSTNVGYELAHGGFRSLFHDKSAVNIERYKVAKKTAKRAVSEAKGRAYDDLYRRLSTKEGEKDVYKIARIRERKTGDLNQVKCIKDEMDQLLVKGQDIKQRWQRIQESEVKEALKRMKGAR